MEGFVTGLPKADVRVFPDAESQCRAAADLMLLLAQRNVERRGGFSVALSGGSTPRRLYALLGSPPYREIMPWHAMHVFWCDERCVAPDRPESNYKLAHDTFLSRVRLPAGQIHRIRGEDDPGAAAQEYEDDLLRFFGRSGASFDLVLLGAGEDGHTASLFPGLPAVKERIRLAVPVVPAQQGISRVTLTLPVLNRSAEALFLVAGHNKSVIVHEIIEDGNPKEYPAGLVRLPHGRVSWMLDREAAGCLTTFVLQPSGTGKPK